MIDLDKYTGHIEGLWCIDENEESDCDGNPDGIHIYALRLRENGPPYPISTGEPLALHVVRHFGDKISWANANLMADAPLLLAEVKRLRKQVSKAKEWVRSLEDKVVYDDFMQQMEMIK